VQDFIDFLLRHHLLALGWVVTFGMLVYSWYRAATSVVKSLSPQQSTMKVNKESALIVDIRPRGEFEKGHIAGSKNVTAEKLKGNDFAGLEKEKNTPIIVVCAAGVAASSTASLFVKAGFADVSVLSGGMNGWTTAGLPTVKGRN
jgi:rhodanese-related sulfurtransferase